MRKTTNEKKKGKRRQHPKWQTGAYERRAQFSFILPHPFLALCRLTDTTPEQLLSDFMDNLSHRSWKREGREKAKEHIVEYFLAHGYGQHHYAAEEIRQIFREMEALGSLFPKNGSSKLVDRYARWRNSHEKYWFKQWFRKPRRKLQKPA